MNKMRIFASVLVLGTGVLAACGSPRGGAQGVGMMTPLTVGPPPIYALLGYRQQLNLTSEQVAALDSIAQGAQEESRPLIEELQTASRDRARQPGYFDVTAEGETIMERIRGNQRRTVDAVADVLSEEQRGTVCRLFPPAGRPGAARQSGPGRHAAETPQARGVGQSSAAWHWCNEEPTEADATELG